jgi:hypothetical protein
MYPKDTLKIIEKFENGWWGGELNDGTMGVFPGPKDEDETKPFTLHYYIETRKKLIFFSSSLVHLLRSSSSFLPSFKAFYNIKVAGCSLKLFLNTEINLLVF